MPTAAPSRCSDPSCGAIATHRGRCERHQRKAWANRSRNADVLSGADRRRFSRAILSRDLVCRRCNMAPAVEADHIIPVALGGSLHDPSNGQGLCHVCHQAKTLDEREAARRLRRPRSV